MISIKRFREWILPREEQVPDYKALKTCSDSKDMESFRSELILLHRHEDTIFNSRLQTFLLVSSFLAAGFSQFREEQYFVVQLIICFCGIVLSLFSMWILIRTAQMIEWYREALHRLDAALIPNENYQPYRTRSLLAERRGQQSRSEGTTVGTAEPPLSTPVSGLLGSLPAFVCLFWLALLIWSVYAISNRPPTENVLSSSPSGQLVKKIDLNPSSEPLLEKNAEPKEAAPCIPDVQSSTRQKIMPSKPVPSKPHN